MLKPTKHSGSSPCYNKICTRIGDVCDEIAFIQEFATIAMKSQLRYGVPRTIISQATVLWNRKRIMAMQSHEIKKNEMVIVGSDQEFEVCAVTRPLRKGLIALCGHRTGLNPTRLTFHNFLVTL
jgi:hypothetical protein